MKILKFKIKRRDFTWLLLSIVKLSHEKVEKILSTKNTAKQYIMVPNSIVRNNGISNMSKLIYTSLTMSRNINQTRLFQQTSINGLLGMVGYKQRTENKNMAKQGLIELEGLNIISIYSDLALSKKIRSYDLKGSTMFFVMFKNDYVYSKEFLNRFSDEEVDKELINAGFTYTTVYIDDAVKLLINDSKHSKANLISLYLMAVSRALIGDMGHKYSTESFDSITKYANINEKTASTYISTLFNAKLLFKLTMREVRRNTGEIRDHNVYSRWCDRNDTILETERDWFSKMMLLKIGDEELSEEQRDFVIKRIREQYVG